MASGDRPEGRGLIEDIATLRDACTADPLKRYRYNVALAVLGEILGLDMDVASEIRTAVLDAHLQINLHEQDDDSELPAGQVAEMKRRIEEPGETIRVPVAELFDHFDDDNPDDHGLMSPPVDGEDAMFWTPECYCGAPWPCPYVPPPTETPDEIHRQDRDR